MVGFLSRNRHDLGKHKVFFRAESKCKKCSKCPRQNANFEKLIRI